MPSKPVKAKKIGKDLWVEKIKSLAENKTVVIVFVVVVAAIIVLDIR